MPGPEPPPLFLFFAIGFVFVAVIAVITAYVRKSDSSDAYQNSLEALRLNPGDKNLRQAAIEAGRTYSRATRNQYGIPSVTESSINYDVDAIVANSAPPQVFEAPKQAIADRLRTLDGLWNQGLITEAEYQARRSAILAEV